MILLLLLSIPLLAQGYRVHKFTMTASADPNFEAHLSSMLKRGAAERPPPEMGSDLRKTFKKSIVASRRSNRSSPEVHI
jgi:hypothetical protein